MKFKNIFPKEIREIVITCKKIFKDQICLNEIFNISKKTISRWIKWGIDYKKKPGRKIHSLFYEELIKKEA